MGRRRAETILFVFYLSILICQSCRAERDESTRTTEALLEIDSQSVSLPPANSPLPLRIVVVPHVFHPIHPHTTTAMPLNSDSKEETLREGYEKHFMSSNVRFGNLVPHFTL